MEVSGGVGLGKAIPTARDGKMPLTKAEGELGWCRSWAPRCLAEGGWRRIPKARMKPSSIEMIPSGGHFKDSVSQPGSEGWRCSGSCSMGKAACPGSSYDNAAIEFLLFSPQKNWGFGDLYNLQAYFVLRYFLQVFC